MANMAIE